MALTITDRAPTVGTTEYSIPADDDYSAGSPQTTVCHAEVMLDLNAVASGDAFELTLYEKATAAATQRAVQSWRFDGPQPFPNVKIPMGLLGAGWDVTVKKITGTDRAIPCSIRTVT